MPEKIDCEAKGKKFVDKSHVFCAKSCRQTHAETSSNTAHEKKTFTGYARYSIENWRNPIKYLLKVNYIQTFYLCALDSYWLCARQTEANVGAMQHISGRWLHRCDFLATFPPLFTASASHHIFPKQGRFTVRLHTFE